MTCAVMSCLRAMSDRTIQVIQTGARRKYTTVDMLYETVYNRVSDSKKMISKPILITFLAISSLSTVHGANQKGRCGYPETDYAPCIARNRANALFRQCCQLYAPDGCHDLCQYEIEEIPARHLLMNAIRSGKCDLKHISAVLYCASQNQDNRKCCEHLNLADAKLGVGNRCLRFCDPAGQGINAISRSDVTCLFNWNVLMYCHHSGIPVD